MKIEALNCLIWRMIRFGAMVFQLAMLLSTTGLAQTTQSPYIVAVRLDKVDLPNSDICTYLAVFADHTFHMERQNLLPRAGDLKALEGSLPPESFDSLTSVLGADDLKNLPTSLPGATKFAQGEMVSVSILRDEKLQNLFFVGVDASGAQRAQPLPTALDPLLQWFKSTTKEIEHLKLKPIKNAKPTSCGRER